MNAPLSVGPPHGSYSWLALAWLSTEAVRTRSREIELGPTFSSFMYKLGLTPVTGKRDHLAPPRSVAPPLLHNDPLQLLGRYRGPRCRRRLHHRSQAPAVVVVMGAPETYAAKIRAEIAAKTTQPITTLVYTHAHNDHIGGSAAFADIEGLEIVALKGVAEFLAEKNDPDRLRPTRTFDDQLVLDPGERESSFEQRTTIRTRATSSSTYRKRAS